MPKFVGESTTQTLTNKTIDGDLNTVQDVAPSVHSHAEADVTGLVSDLAGKQPLDGDLTAIAGLTATTDNFIQSKSSAWASRTPTQVTADLIAMVGDSGAGGTKGLVPAPASGDTAANKYLKANGTWTAISSGGQSTYDAIVAATGGDYTTLGAAITAASAGWRIFVKDGTYSESAISTALADLTIEGESNNKAVISHGANNITFSGANCSVRYLGFTGSTATVLFSGTEAKITQNRFIYSSTALVRFTGQKASVQNNYFAWATTGTVTTTFIETGAYTQFAGNFITANARSTTASTGVLKSSGGYVTITGNVFLGLQSSVDGGYILLGGDTDTITGNTFKDWMNSGFTTNARILLQGGTFAGNFTEALYIQTTGAKCTIANNNINTTGGTSNIVVGIEGVAITGNSMTGANGCATGILISSAIDNTVISGNYIHRYATQAISITSTANNTNISGNNFSTQTTPIVDAGTGTIIQNNYGTYPSQESKIISATNTSGGALSAGQIVVLKAVASGNEVTTTTTGGDSKVYGMSIDAPANNAKGRILVKGKTTLLKADGTTDIAIGDFLSTFTTAGIVQKATAGQTAIAIALEAYATNDSLGVLDAILIEPRVV